MQTGSFGLLIYREATICGDKYRATHASRRPQYGGRLSGLNPAPQPITDYLPKLFIATYAMLSGYWEYAFGIKIPNNSLPGEGEI